MLPDNMKYLPYGVSSPISAPAFTIVSLNTLSGCWYLMFSPRACPLAFRTAV